MQFQGAVILALGQEVGIVTVEPHVLNSPDEYDEIRVSAQKAFGQGVFGWRPVILMALDEKRVPTYSGPYDIVNFLADLDFDQFPWQHYAV